MIRRSQRSTLFPYTTLFRSELVRLYEEAASLYMHTGDNMLAIYASEKALRLAERLGDVRCASRAHGIFGRVLDRKSTRLNSSHTVISYAVFCLKKKKFTLLK